MKTVIMAGGKGTRIASIASDIPKPMIPLCGKPLLEYQIDCLTKNSLTDIIIVTGHLGQRIQDYFGDGKKFNCTISYYAETEPLGTAGALYKLQDILGDTFILINGDILFDMDFSRMTAFHQQRNSWAALAAHPNSHPFDSALLVTDTEHRVIRWLTKEDERRYYKNQVNAGIHILTQKLLNSSNPASEKVDLDRDILKPLIHSGKIYAYNTPEYIKDMGTPERYRQVSLDIEQGFVARRNLSKPQKAVFIDRDGTINKPDGFVRKPEDLTLINGAAEGIRRINQAGYLAIVITNQPVIARGEVTLEELEEIHHKMETDLGRFGAYLEDIFFCPHHPDKGYPGEREEYKIDCSCRKPKPGMILQGAAKYNIDLTQSYMVGDSKRDVLAGIAAGCKPVWLTEKYAEKTEQIDGHEVLLFADLNSFVQTCI
jgi:D,D-heptose 1,7-bisphosphate phosphatase